MENKITSEIDNFIEEIDSRQKRKKEGAYDYIANNYYKFSKQELVDILKEFIYESINSKDFKIENVIENLKENEC
jgi:hypothetical protein